MRKYWWTVWIKAAVLALLLFLGYRYVSNQIEDIVSPYLIEQSDEDSDSSGNALMSVLGKIEGYFDVRIDFENLIFDYANDFAQDIKEESRAERNPVSEPLS